MDKRDEKVNDEVITRQIIESARDYHANDFPNPSRIGCPPTHQLLKVVNSKSLPDKDFLHHILNCSPCYREFVAFREEKVSSATISTLDLTTTKTPWLSFFGQPLFAAALFVLAVGVTGALLYVWFGQNEIEVSQQPSLLDPGKQEEVMVKNHNDSPNILNNNIEKGEEAEQFDEDKTLNPASVKNQESAVKNEKTKLPKIKPIDEQKLLAQNIIALDLSKAAVTRSKGSKEIDYSLPARAVILNVKLPENSPAGNYEISLLDEATGEPLLANQTKSSSRKNLNFKIDLQNRRGHARLCLALQGEIPDCLKVHIGNKE